MSRKVRDSTAKNFLHGYALHDIFKHHEVGIPIIIEFFYALKCARTMLTRGTLVNDYFWDLLLWKTKAFFRTSLLAFIYFIMMYILDAGLVSPVPAQFPANTISSLLILHLSLYLLTFRNLSHRTYTNLAFIMCLLTVAINCWAYCTLLSENATVYTPYFGFILTMGVLLPLKFDLVIVITIMMFCSNVMLQLHRRSIAKHHETVTNEPIWYMFDIFRYLKKPRKKREVSNIEHAIDSLLWLVVFSIAMYLRFWNELRRKFVLFKLGKSVTARNDAQKAVQSKLRWIDAIMPSQVTTEYYKLKKLNEDSGVSMWVYSKVFNNVSILFADIVGFTNMSSNRTAYQVVMLLNDLFSRFDQLCQLTQCEKIGTLGDCYYCVAGCPEPQPSHAMSCVEMGLGMCRIIKVFNCDHYEAVGMRVGVHTGRVNAAIIGSQRFRYDVYSYDVIIANNLESSGKPGRVHISETTFNEVKSLYNVSLGEDLTVRKEELYGIAGSTLTDFILKTYFVDPRSSLLRQKHEKFNENAALRSINREVKSEYFGDSDSDTISSVAEESSQYYNAPIGKTNANDAIEMVEKDEMELRRDVDLIETLQNDPEHQVQLFRSPPLDPITLQFLNPETEWHYQEHTKYYMIPTYIDSQKVAPLADIIALFIACSYIQVVCVFKHAMLKPIHGYEMLSYLATLAANLVCNLIIVFQTTAYLEQLESPLTRKLYRLFNHATVKELCLSILTFTPTVTYYILYEASVQTRTANDRHSELARLSGLCMLIHCIPVSSTAWCRMLSAFLTLMMMHFEMSHPIQHSTEIKCSQNPTIFFFKSISSVSFASFSAELLCCFYFVSLITRENERNCRLCFYVNREAEITCDLSDIAVNEAQDMLFNIIPRHVYCKLEKNTDEVTASSLSYATTLKNVGVVFACISNFFSNYYREDYHGGERSLMLLNSLICSFDTIVNSEAMKSVDKIKTINDCYMAAAGLDQEAVDKSLVDNSHLVDLMEMCHLLKEELDKFNDMYIVGLDSFTLKIGYNFGPVTAGIIGTTKPLFDIWGDTVNVASRMYSTGLPGQVQAPSHVVPLLEDYYDFNYRGDTFVKGKGNMATYICTRKSLESIFKV